MTNVAQKFSNLEISIKKKADQFSVSPPKLIAVSKRQPDNRIQDALDYGHRIFGENKVQEAYEHWEKRKDQYPDLELHCLGPLQSNKVQDAVALFDVIHTVGREKIARYIARYSKELGREPKCFIQVNTGDEDQKSGIMIKECKAFYDYCVNEQGINVTGLMCLPPIEDSASFHFALLQKKAQELGLKELSMGMSADYEEAIKFGSTHIRCGTAVFGARPS